jgi:hypothetical protein
MLDATAPADRIAVRIEGRALIQTDGGAATVPFTVAILLQETDAEVEALLRDRPAFHDVFDSPGFAACLRSLVNVARAAPALVAAFL